MANEQNLMDINEVNARKTPEERSESARKAGIASGEKKRQKKTYAELARIYGECKLDAERQAKLKQMGIDDDDLTHKMAVVASQYDKAEDEGNTQAATWIRETEEGKLSSKAEVEVSGEVSGITINVKKYDKGE